ncbi:portal_HK97, phage portal protein, HK97 family [uncultured Caudovirales phage]|jgi:HK97 family phage portal protein|uniref:Portal_HK97, phage portal protein, HK97 family n=1 Tax=uncultured Caudovirales phage TaxID=2100421 RepID=A0A6J5NP23_9CAUD|nr:portal_HK97, phage portal protein, HK97 family [uncultured Caudovirales phage]
MGIFSRKPQVIEAQYAPQVMGENMPSIYNALVARVSRHDAMTVPSVARARNLICGTVGSIPLEYYNKRTGEVIAPPRWISQLSKSQPSFVTLTWIVDSLLFYGVSYLLITERYAEDGRPSSFEWVANTRVTFTTDLEGMFVTQYYIDASPVNMNDIVTIQGFDEGVLERGGRTIQAAIDVERAAAVNSANPQPTGFLKNSGADLPPNEVQGLIAAWKRARQNNSTAYLTSTLDYNPVSFSPKDMMYDSAIQTLSTQIARTMNVPAYLLSSEANTSMTYSNIQDERKQFFALSLEPYIQAIQARMSMDDISTSGHEVRFAVYDTFLKQDPMAELSVIEKMLSLGLITTEQAMEMTDLTPNGSEGIS